MSKTAKLSHVWERDPLDFYVEPEAATQALLNVERFVGYVWDPCCGGANMRRNAQFLCAPCNLRKHASGPINFARREGRLI